MATQLHSSAPSPEVTIGPLGISAFEKSLKGRAGSRAPSTTLTVPQAMADLMTAIEPNDAEREKASKQQQNLRAALDEHLALKATYLSGSYRRRTLIRPVDDIDLLVVLDHDKHSIGLDAAGARRALDLVEAALRKAYPKTEMVRHDRCIQLKFSGTGIGFDVVPVIQLTEHEFYIPDTRRGKWITTNPREVERLVTEANKRSDGYLVPLVKLLKAWKDAADAPVRGFHLEAMAYHQLVGIPADEREGLAFLLGELATAIWSNCPDIWPMGEAADATLSQADRTKAASMLAAAASDAQRALKAEREDRPDDAHAIWYRLFGDRYPETGGNRVSAEKMSVPEAVSAVAAGRAFGATTAGLIKPSVGLASVRSATSHGGTAEAFEQDDLVPNNGHAEAQRAYLEEAIAEALTQFPGLERVDLDTATGDSTLWPMHRGPMRHPYAVLVGTQRTNYGTEHRILVKVPSDLPATEPRVYLLRQHVDRRVTGFGARGIRTTGRTIQHQWGDRSMCTHALRDRWDGRLVTMLVYAADWLFRQEHFRRFGIWIGRSISADGRHQVHIDPLRRKRARSRGRR